MLWSRAILFEIDSGAIIEMDFYKFHPKGNFSRHLSKLLYDLNVFLSTYYIADMPTKKNPHIYFVTLNYNC